MRLTPETVETSCREMWDAIAGLPGDDDHAGRQALIDQARQIEARLRLRLAAQDRLDLAAPMLLEAGRKIIANANSDHPATIEAYIEGFNLLERAIRIVDNQAPPIGTYPPTPAARPPAPLKPLDPEDNF